MALVAPSTLSSATDGVRNALANHLGNDATVIVDIPHRAEDLIKDGTPVVNLFFYKILPSGFHAGAGTKDPLMLRLHCLITPFSKDTQEQTAVNQPATTEPAGEINLKLLGKVISYFHQNPIIGPLPPDDQNPDGTRYTLETVLRAPDMEEINHVWMTQGNDIPYRTSAVYEFSLIPLDPEEFAAEGTRVEKYAGELRPIMETKDEDFDENTDEIITNIEAGQ